MKLVRKQPSTADRQADFHAPRTTERTMNRREFLQRSGITVSGVAAVSALPFSMVKKAAATTEPSSGGDTKQIRTVCTHCSVGCGIYAEVKNGVWTGQEPAFDHPFNRGAH